MCPHAVHYQPFYFFSRYPQKTTKLWNLKNLLTPGSWLMYFMTIICILLFIKLSVYVGKKLGLNTFTEEITLVPFRCVELIVKLLALALTNLVLDMATTMATTTQPPPYFLKYQKMFFFMMRCSLRIFFLCP